MKRSLLVISAEARTRRSLVLGACAALCLLSAAPDLVLAQSRGTTTSSMFGSSQVGSPGGASASGYGSGMTTGQGSTNGNASTPGGAGGAGLGSSLGLGANMQNFQAGGQTGFVGSSANSVSNVMSRQGTAGGLQAGRLNFGTLGNLMTRGRQNQFNQQQAQKASRAANLSVGRIIQLRPYH